MSTGLLGKNLPYFDGPPIVFETMVFLNGKEWGQRRYSTWEEAEAGHKEAGERHLHAAAVVNKLKES